ncbi:MAG TPA: TonB-dependent receptor [Vicinamibacterales bacterium]|jgi:outer membrane receptor protein involved in Fe transport|nr:TonB-dependent receptor [Vicinamibacterales bacterium]
MPRRHVLIGIATLLSVSLVLGAPAPAAAQSPTGTISGRVADTNGGVLPGVTATLSSPALQGTQIAVTTEHGDYIFSLLPPGVYTVRFTLNGFEPLEKQTRLGATESVDLDATLQTARVTENITVSADADTFVDTVQVATNLKLSDIDVLPVTTRTIGAYLNLTPSVHGTGPGNETTIAGAPSYENVILVNGVQTQDNVRGDALPLYIEDAIEETTVATSGVSAQYGRFNGGLVNAVTKSGSNAFSGSFRTSFTNDAWRTKTPFDEPQLNATVPAYEFTLGGPIVRDKTWFFGAGRVENQDKAEQTLTTNIPYTFSNDEARYEAKVTQSLGTGQRLQVDYIGISNEQKNSDAATIGIGVMDLASLINAQFPQNQVSAHYTGTFGSKFFVESQYSTRRFIFKNAGGTNTDRILGTPLLDYLNGGSWWAPGYCGVCKDEQRNNDEFIAKGNYFISTPTGAHNITFGYDTFNDRMIQDNHQSASDWHVWATTSTVADGVVYPVIEPGQSTIIIHWPLLASSQGTNFRTHALFLQDDWRVDNHLTFNLGVRYDKNHGEDASGHVVANDAVVSPRLGVVWDPTGAGTTTISASYSRYVAAISNPIASQGSGAGLPSIFAYFYDGDPINVDPGQPLVSSEQALEQVFAWYDAAQPGPIQVTIPGVQTQIRGSLESPHVDEVALGVSRTLGQHGAVRADVVDRRFGDFYGVRTDTTTGQGSDDFGNTFDLSYIENTNLATRRYTALTTQGTYRLGTRLNLGASYTLSYLRGNDDGEDLGSGPLASTFLYYPEYSQSSWAYPEGDLSADQRHNARLWGTIAIPTGSTADQVSVSLVEQMQSGTPYGAVADVELADADGNPFVANPGYLTPPQTTPYYFTARDAFHTAAMYRTDLSLNYTRRMGPGAHALELFGRFQVFNIFNQFQAFNITAGQINTTVLTAANDPDDFQVFNPFTETPVEGVNWEKGSKFGQPVSSTAYTLPRTFQFSVGVRF